MNALTPADIEQFNAWKVAQQQANAKLLERAQRRQAQAAARYQANKEEKRQYQKEKYWRKKAETPAAEN